MGGRNMDYKAMNQQWLDNPYFDEETKAELKTAFIWTWSLVQQGCAA